MLHYTISGKGKETLVLLHGFLESSNIWQDFLPYLEEHFTLICIDLPGHGKSPCIAETQTMELMASAVKETLQSLPLEKFHLLGHSMGGYISLAYAEIFPEDLLSLTLFFSTYQADDDDKKENRRKSFRIIKEEFGKYINAGVPLLFSTSERNNLQPKIQFTKQIALSTPTEGAIASVKGMIERPDRRNILNQLSAKIILLLGKHDAAVPSLQLLQDLPDADNIKAYLLDCGHQGHLEAPSICGEILKKELLLS